MLAVLRRHGPPARAFGVRADVNGAYLAWDELRHRPPPAGLTRETWWFLIDDVRRSSSRELPLRDAGGEPFVVATPGSVQRLIYTVDRDASGRIEMPELVVNAPQRDRYVISSLMEEAITSSQLEGASTTRRVAKEMIRTGRPPRTPDEKMISNNYRAMEWVRDRREQPITPELVLELHSVLTDGTLDGAADAAGRFRRADEEIMVVDRDDDEVLHVPPPADELPTRMATLCRFATGELDDDFIHPVLRSIVLHFWIGFDHPFVDGNGRTARALFYWSMLREGYWLTEFLSISRLLKKAPARYARAYLHSEVHHDATYFVVHQLDTIRQAIDELTAYLERKSREVRDTEQIIKRADDLNHRQLALISHALRNPDTDYTIEGHRRSHAIVYQTARKDLLDLADRGWLVQRKRSKSFVFTPAPDLARRLASARPATRRGTSRRP